MRKIYLLLSLAYLLPLQEILALPGNASYEKKHYSLFASDVIQPADLTVCNGATTSTVVFTSNFPGTIFNWTNSNTSIGLSASGTGNLPAFTAVNTGIVPVTATITVTPSDGSTNGTPKTFTITVNPTPTVNNISSQILCQNSTTAAVNFSGTVPGTVFNWTNSNPAIGLAGSGSGNIPSFTATNSSSAPITATVTVTPQFGSTPPEWLYYKFDGAGTTVPNLASNPPAGTANATINGTHAQVTAGNCVGRLRGSGSNNVTSQLNTGWAPNFSGSFTISFIADGFASNAGLSYLAGFFNSGSPANSLYIGFNAGVFSMEVQSNKWVATSPVNGGVHTITFVYDATALVLRAYLDGVLSNTTSLTQPLVISGNAFYVGAFANDFGNNPCLRFAQSMDEFRMYNRALSLAEIQGMVNSCTSGVSCNGTSETFDITVYPDLVVNNPADQTICAGSATTAVNFTGTSAVVYNWTNNNPSIGLAASGTGNIPSFTPVLSGNSPVTATITVTPSFTSGPACTASSQSFTITVNPIPTVNTITSQTVCNNSPVSTINFSGAVSGTGYNWTNSNPAIGLAASGSGNIPSFTAINNTGSPISAIITVTPVFGTCSGSPEIFGITVNPSPTVDAVSNQSVCNNTATNAINFTGNVAGAAYNWTNSNPSIGLAASGTGNIPSFTAVNAGSTTEVATITVTPVSPTQPSCPGTPESFTFSVSPVPTGTASPASQTVCSESAINPILFTGNVPGITFDWTRDNLSTVTGIPGAGNGDISGTLTNTTNAPVLVIFTVTPSLGGCVGTPFNVRIIVNESLPTATVSPSSQTICSGNITDIIPSSNYAGATFNWTRDNTTSVTGISASGNGTISGTLFNTTTSPVTVTFTITPTFNGCDGAAVTATVLVNAVPTIICPADISINNSTGICGAPANYNTTVTGAPAPTLSYSFSGASSGSGSGNGSGSVFNVGVTNVTVTATNICGTASCSFTVTVNDTQNPTITCPASIQTNTDPGICAASVVTPNPTIADNCAATVLTWTLSGATTGTSATTGINFVGTRLFNKGVTTVNYTVKDAAGNTATCSFTVTVRDLENPVALCPSNITVTTPIGSCTAIVNYTVNATDNCPGVTTQLISGPASGSAFPIGITTVSWRATDAAGNLSPICSFTVTVLDGQLPVISAQPATQTVCSGSNVTYSVTAGNVVTYQWQQWNGSAWVNISGANASTYTVNNVTVANNAATYRVVLNGLCTNVNSAAASLFVNPLPAVSISFNPLSQLLPSQFTTIVSTVSPAGGSYVWRRNNNVVVGALNEVLDGLTVDQLGTYQLTYTDLNGCVSNSGSLVLTALESPRIWVYPSPNNGRFQVRYYNNFGEPVTVRVFNSAGQLVYSRELVTTDAYSRIDVDLGNQSQGVYIVKVYDTKSRELAAKKILVYR